MSEHTCDTPDKCRIQVGLSTTTMVYYPPIYDGHGNNLNPDMNITTTEMKCLTCGKEWIDRSRGESK